MFEIYVLTTIFVFIGGSAIAVLAWDDPKERRIAARVALSSPVWPILILVWLFVTAFRK